jgi:superfamily II DNA or RNA helicase
MPVDPPVDIPNLLSRAMRRQVSLSEFSQPVYIEDAQAVDELVSLTVRTRDGQTIQTIVPAAELAAALEQATAQSTTGTLASPLDFFLLVEAARIRLAYSFDPFFAVSMSGVQALPHQLQAVYERMLPQARLRFLLADDPGAGKTIMAGLLLKELKLRGVVTYVLILTPAPLTIQWQDELYSKFDETFEIVNSDMVGNQLAGNVWERYRQCIASLDFAKQERITQNLEQIPWDLIIIDEAHKCSAHTQGEKVAKTRRYQLAERLSAGAERILLLTATPHSGDPDQFAHFLRLLDADQFPDPRYDGLQLDRKILEDARAGGRDQWFLRRIKEELRDRAGNPLFTKRHVSTVPFKLTWPEEQLYKHVTEYINLFLPYQQGGGARRNSVALAHTVLQRRLASSLHAILRSLERRANHFRDILQELERLPASEHEKILYKYRLLASSGYEDEESDSGDLDEQQEEAMENFPVMQRVDQLRVEVQALEKLVQEAAKVVASGEESKLKALRTCIEGAQFHELNDGRGKLLIFTEHRDTLAYLRSHLQKWGYTTCEIHGGMNAVLRREAAQRFYESAQICIATEAAGEGINLQFCHLMINYDIPWNPNRLEQRMGRIHRIGQRSDVYIFNFVSTDTVEGIILDRLFDKLEEIRVQLGDRVFDVVGQLLALNEIRLEDMLREVAMNRARVEEYTGQIERLSTAQLAQLEQATGVALATSQVDLAWVHGTDIRSQERRLMPEYVEKFFLRAAEREKMSMRHRVDGLYTIERVPARLRDQHLVTARRYGIPAQEYRKLTFDKTVQQREEHQDAVLLSPGHPLFAALSEVLLADLESLKGHAAVFVDPRAGESYQAHFFEVQIVSEEPVAGAGRDSTAGESRTQVLYATLAAILDGPRGKELAPADLLHDLTPLPEDATVEVEMSAPDPQAIVTLEQWLRIKVQFPLKQQQAKERQRLLQIRREYISNMFGEQIKQVQHRYMQLYQRVQKGDEAARLARDAADRRKKELRVRQREKLAELDRLQVVREGVVRYIGTALVAPIAQTSLAAQLEQEANITTGELVRDELIEQTGMDYVMNYERAQGRQPEDISKNYDGSGFDIRSTDPLSGELRRIEVKSRVSEGEFVELTPNEWLQARRHAESYWLYVVWNCASDPYLITIQNPAQALANVIQEQVVIEGYRVPGEAIARLNMNESDSH